jgi:hypothetical protein
MFATADYDVANEGHDKPYTYGRSKYPRCKLCEDGKGTAEGGRETAQMLGYIRPRRTCAGCPLCLSLSHILPLSVYVIPAPPYSNAIPAHFIWVLSLYPICLLFLNNNPSFLCNKSRYTRLFTFKIHEVINTLIKE